MLLMSDVNLMLFSRHLAFIISFLCVSLFSIVSCAVTATHLMKSTSHCNQSYNSGKQSKSLQMKRELLINCTCCFAVHSVDFYWL